MYTVNKKENKWIRPWDGKPEAIYDRDDRFFSVVIKGALAWLTNNIVMYGKPIRHFILNTGSSYMYVETNGYTYSVTEVTNEDTIYMERPRCIVEITSINADTAELTQPYVRGVYERLDSKDGQIKGYNAEIQRIPIEVQLNLQYVLSTFNESIVLTQELLDKMCFQRYFSIVYLGQVIKCALEFPRDFNININKIDMSSAEANNKTIALPLILSTSYPAIDEDTEMPNSAVISGFHSHIGVYHEKYPPVYDVTSKTIT